MAENTKTQDTFRYIEVPFGEDDLYSLQDVIENNTIIEWRFPILNKADPNDRENKGKEWIRVVLMSNDEYEQRGA